MRKRNLCSAPLSPGSLIAPPEPRTRCHGNPGTCRRTRTTWRAAPGQPAARATAPYVETFPRGRARMARTMLCVVLGLSLVMGKNVFHLLASGSRLSAFSPFGGVLLSLRSFFAPRSSRLAKKPSPFVVRKNRPARVRFSPFGIAIRRS